ncbi:hypothetical protein FKM82_000236 [Ascaphus truei]
MALHVASGRDGVTISQNASGDWNDACRVQLLPNQGSSLSLVILKLNKSFDLSFKRYKLFTLKILQVVSRLQKLSSSKLLSFFFFLNFILRRTYKAQRVLWYNLLFILYNVFKIILLT